MAAPVSVSVIVPARNAAASLPACLDAIAVSVDELRSSRQVDTEIIVVDDDSTDDTARVAATRPGVKVVAGRGIGSYAARNAGIAEATGEFIAFTDADCMPAAAWLTSGTAAMFGFDLVGGAIEFAAGPTTAVGRYDGSLYLRQADFVADQGFAATANLFTRLEVFKSIGGFDGRLRSGGDFEWCRRAGRAGFRLGYSSSAVIRHQPRTTYLELWRLHRRLGAGMADLAQLGLRPAWWRDPALRWPTLSMVVESVAASGDPLRRRELIGPHAVAMAGRWTGRLSGR